MIGWLLAVALGFAVGMLLRHLVARRQAATMMSLLARQQVLIAQQLAAAQRLVQANKHLDHWCGRFRDLYLGTVAQIDPALAVELRAKWAHVQAPGTVARLLERVRHG